MVDGDHPHTAVAIAREIGLVKSANPVVLEGEVLRKNERRAFASGSR